MTTLIKPMLAATLALAASVHAHAAVNLYTSEAAYLAAVGATQGYTDFAGTPGATVPGGGFLTGVTFGSCPEGAGSCGTEVFHNSNGITDLGGSPVSNGVAPLGASFTAPVQAFGFHYVSGGIASVELGALGTLDTSAASGFIGVVSDTGISSFVALNALFPGGAGADRYFIDDFRVNAPVPEPETWAMVIAGLALLPVLRRRGAAAARGA